MTSTVCSKCTDHISDAGWWGAASLVLPELSIFASPSQNHKKIHPGCQEAGENTASTVEPRARDAEVTNYRHHLQAPLTASTGTHPCAATCPFLAGTQQGVGLASTMRKKADACRQIPFLKKKYYYYFAHVLRWLFRLNPKIDDLILMCRKNTDL